jgi:cytochrome bd-type quinol oxidase subunit 2
MDFERITKLVPLISVVTLAFVAIFNVGYFTEIGLHFIGIVDVTNLAYSFGLFFPVIAVLLNGFSSSLLSDLLAFTKKDGADERIRAFAKKWFLPILIVVILAALGLNYYFDLRVANDVLSAAFFVLFIFVGLIAKIKFHRDGRLHWDDVTVCIFFLFVSTAYLGRAIASGQVNDRKNSYTVVTKDVPLIDARLVRSSSNGFLIMAGERIMFVPKDEIKHIRSNFDIRR